MHATCSQPVAEPTVFSNDFAILRARPIFPWATSTRQACRIGRNTADFVSQPTRRTWTPCRAPRGSAAGAVTPRSVSTIYKRETGPLTRNCSSSSAAAWFSCTDAGIAAAAIGRPVTSTHTARFAPFTRPYGPP